MRGGADGAAQEVLAVGGVPALVMLIARAPVRTVAVACALLDRALRLESVRERGRCSVALADRPPPPSQPSAQRLLALRCAPVLVRAVSHVWRDAPAAIACCRALAHAIAREPGLQAQVLATPRLEVALRLVLRHTDAHVRMAALHSVSALCRGSGEARRVLHAVGVTRVITRVRSANHRTVCACRR